MKILPVKNIFLLYVGIMLLITFLQQEFVMIPELQSFDLVGEDTKAKMLERLQKWRWTSFLLPPLLLLLRLSFVSLCLFVGSFFFADMNGKKFGDWWNVALVAQSVMILYSVILCIINIIAGADKAVGVANYISLLFLRGNNIEQWIKIPLSAINIFEIVYWLFMAKMVNIETDNSFGKSFKFVMSSYGVGYMFYIVLLMFLILYMN